MKKYFATHAPILFGMGYPVLPAEGKRVFLENWSEIVIDEATVNYWVSNGQARHNVGMRCGDASLSMALTMGDVDIYDRDIARLVATSIEETFGATIERRGQAPKRGLIYCQAEPFAKIKKVWYSPDGVKHTVEWLGDGQQFIAFGMHPDTKKEYTWRDDKSLLDCEPWELPQVTEEAVLDWMDNVLPGLIPAGWVIGSDKGPGTAVADQRGLSKDERVLLNYKAPLDIDVTRLVKALMSLDADMEYDDWFRIGMALHHQFNGSDEGRGYFDEWSKTSKKYPGYEQICTKWKTFGADYSRSGGVVTAATILHLAAEFLKKLDREEAGEAAAAWLERIAVCENGRDIEALAQDEISKDKALMDTDRANLVKAIQNKLVEMGCAKPEAKIIRGWLKRKGYRRLPDLNSDSKPQMTAENVRAVCDNLDVVIRYNVISKEDEILIPGQSWTVDNRNSAALSWVRDACQRQEVPTMYLKPYITMLADQNPYNPVITWVTSVPWDGISRLADWFATVKERQGCKKLKEILMRKWAISAIRAAFEPFGSAAQGILVFQGAQRKGKTRWIENLAPRELDLVKSGLNLDLRSKDSIKMAISFWIGELGELDATFKKSDISALKAFSTNPYDVLRKPYAEAESKFPRRTVFAASVNDEKFLQDPTGNLRYWVIPIETLDHSHNIDMQQFWAEVLELYRAGEIHYLLDDELKTLDTHNEDFTVESPIAELVASGLDWANFNINKCNWMSASDALRWLGIKSPTKAETIEAGRTLSQLNGGHKKKSNGFRTIAMPLRRIFVTEGAEMENSGAGGIGRVEDAEGYDTLEIPF